MGIFDAWSIGSDSSSAGGGEGGLDGAGVAFRERGCTNLAGTAAGDLKLVGILPGQLGAPYILTGTAGGVAVAAVIAERGC